jgi:hypothetical protein
VKNVFLHGTLSKTVYYSQLMGFVDPTQSDRVCRLNKSLYGLKQVPWAWYIRFATYLITLGFVEAKSDTSLFIFRCDTNTIYLLFYIDDIVLTASSTTLLQSALFTIFWGSPYNMRQMDSTSFSVSSLSMSLSTLAWWTVSRSRCPWTCRPKSLPLLGLLLLI